MLTEVQARGLLEGALNNNHLQQIAPVPASIRQTPSLRGWLRDWRALQLANKYTMVDNIRIYRSNAGSTDDICARGIDMARAAAELLTLSEASEESKDCLRMLIEVYLCSQAVWSSTKKKVSETKEFHGALADLLYKTGLTGTKKQTYAALFFMRDFLWKRDFETPYCVIEQLPANAGSLIRYAEPIRFIKGNYWDKLDERPWFVAMKQRRFGNQPWFDTFINRYGNLWKTYSSTPMTRMAPNPANAVSMSDILVTDQDVVVLGHHIRTAVTEPLAVAAKQSRQPITNKNHQQLIIPQMKKQLQEYMSIWSAFHEEGPIPLTILHQTLIGDEVTFTPDQRKALKSKFSGSVIDSKSEANKQLREALTHRYAFYYKPVTEKLIRVARKESDFNDKIAQLTQRGYRPVEIQLLETNHCINMWQHLARVRNNDINHSRALVDQAASLFRRVNAQAHSEDLQLLINFLESANHSFFTPFKYRGPQVKETINRVSRSITQGTEPFADLSKKTRMHLALSLQSAVELKCMIHETWGGSFRRTISNWSRSNLRRWYFLGIGHLADLVIRSSLKILASIVKIPVLFSLAAHSARHVRDRELVYLSAYEGLLTESIGLLTGGCMSALDRAGEMAEFRASLKKQFICEGRIVGYNDSQLDKTDFFRRYGSTVTKHVQAEMASGIAGTNDSETKGFGPVTSLMVKTETGKQIKQSEQLVKLRKGACSKAVKFDRYLYRRNRFYAEPVPQSRIPQKEDSSENSQDSVILLSSH